MADATDPDSSRDSSSSSDKDQGWYAQQWNLLCDELGISDPTDALARVQTMKREMKRIQSAEQGEEDEGLVTISEVEEVFRDMNRKMEKLRERNAALVKRLEKEGDDLESPFHNLHQQVEQLLDTLGTATMDEARERVQSLNDRLEDLYREKEQLAKAGLSDANDAVNEIEQLREQRDALRRERDRLQTDRNRLEQQLEEADEPDDASSSDASTDLDAPLQEAASIMRDKIGVSNAPQATAFVQIVRQLHARIESMASAHGVELDEDPDNVVELLRSMTMHLDEMPDPEAIPPSAAEVLGANTPSEARTLADTVRRVGSRIIRHYEESVEFEDVDPDTADALTLLRTLEDRLLAIPEPGAPTKSADSPDQETASSDDILPAEAGDILGIRTVEDARELEALIGDMSDRLDRLSEEHEKLDDAGLTVDEALSMIENMEAQLADLYHGFGSDSNGLPDEPSGLTKLDDALRYRVFNLTDATPEAIDDVTQVVRILTDRVDQLAARQESLIEAGLSPDEAVAMIESMEGQLNALYRAQEQDDADAAAEAHTESKEPRPENKDAAERLAAIEEVLGISTRSEAVELSQIAREMEEQLTVLYQDKEKLEELGLDTIDDAVALIKSMEDQLVELYEDKEAIVEVQAEMKATEKQSTFQQLEALYAEREKMQQALGVCSADEVIEMVESLNSQLDELYTGRDADVDPEERHDVLLWEPDEEDSSPSDDTAAEDSAPNDAAPDDTGADGADADLTMNSMEHQLESLYREKETLLHHGFSSAQEAVSQLQTQQKQIDALQRENHTYEQRFERLQSELGTARVPRIVDLVQTLESDADVSLEDVLDRPGKREDPEYGLDIEATSPFVADETLDRLDEMDSSALDDLDVGIVRLGDDGTVEDLNEAAFQLPGLSVDEDRASVIGKNFFLELAPSTNNNLFYGRFQKGQRRGEMDARFPYTFTSPDEGPQPFAVHLHRKPNGEATWLLYRPT